MKLLRSFLPVGQGAFYVEKFVDDNGERVFTAVYDCGAQPSVTRLRSEIEHYFHKNETIDALFISHFHEDHVNGLEKLFERCTVNNLCIPYVNDSKIWLFTKLQYLASGGQVGSKAWQIIEWAENGDVPRLNNQNPKMHLHKISEETFVKIRDDIEQKWILNAKPCYVPINMEAFERAFLDEFGECSAESVLEQLKKGEDKKIFNKLHSIYKKAASDLNLTSLLLYSGPKNTELNQTPLNCPCRCCYNVNIHEDITTKKAGCLYTGDFNAKTHWDKCLKKFIEPYEDDIGCIQIPHHGSKNSFNEKLADINAHKIISVGTKNTYGHPGDEVLKKLSFGKGLVYCVTELPCSGVTFEIDIE